MTITIINRGKYLKTIIEGHGNQPPPSYCKFNGNKLPPPRYKALLENPSYFIKNVLTSQFITSLRSKEPITTSCTNITGTQTALSDNVKNVEAILGNFNCKASTNFAEKRSKILLSKYQIDVKKYFLVPIQLLPDNPFGELLSYVKQNFNFLFLY